ncbi:MAG TPA: hypothetical protein VI260_22375 [Blastocatellia bacterium]|jgi:hypothetical protein
MKKAFLLSLLISGSLVSIAQEQKITMPMTANAPEDFAPKGWEIDAVEKGDLNGDKIDDAAIVMTKPEVMENDTLKESSKRFLVLAFGDGSQFKRMAFSDEAALDKDEGGAMGDPFQELKIEKGIVIINYYGGSAWRWGVTQRYRWQQNRWILIGNTYEGFHATEPDETSSVTDTNLSTGFVHRTDANIEDENGRKKPPKKGDYYELQAITTNEAQKIDGFFDSGEWQGYVLKLNADKQVVRDVPLWNGISDVSAALNAVRQGEDLFIRAEVIDDQLSEGDGLRLINKKGLVIAPKEIKTAPTPKGYNVEARYSMKDLAKFAPEREGGAMDLEYFLRRDGLDPANIGFFAAVEVIDVDGKTKRATLSTKLRGSPFNGSIRVYQAGVVVLENK